MSERPPVIALWYAHRNPGQRLADLPSSVDKGVRELRARGYEVHDIYPGSLRRRMPALHALLKQRLAYKLDIPELVWMSRRPEAVILTSSIEWARIVAALKLMGVLRNRFVFSWEAIDGDVESLRTGRGAKLRQVARAMDACTVPSLVNARELRDELPEARDRIQFWPVGVDMAYYRRFRSAAGDAPPTWDVVAAGSDVMRDWSVPLELARRGLKVALVTEDARVAARLAAASAEVRARVDLFLGVGFARSAEVMARGACLLVSTLPNARFSGSTTAGVAAGLGRPLVIDAEEEARAYGLRPGVACEVFGRGDAADAERAVRRIVGHPPHAAKVADAIAAASDRLDIGAFADMLEGMLRPGWRPRDFAPSA